MMHLYFEPTVDLGFGKHRLIFDFAQEVDFFVATLDTVMTKATSVTRGTQSCDC